MSTENPQKRLVRLKEYAGAVAGKGILGSTAYVFLGGGLLLLVAGIFFAVTGGLPAFAGYLTGATGLFLGGVLSGLGLAGTYRSTKMFAKIEQMEPLALLTKENAKHLPEVETLVRGSDCPPTAEQAALLRAAGQGVGTPAEQLLRAVQGERQDV